MIEFNATDEWYKQAAESETGYDISAGIEPIFLKECPFCNSPKLRISCDDFGWAQFKIRRQSWWIQCRGEHCYALQQGSTKEKVIERWNNRK